MRSRPRGVKGAPNSRWSEFLLRGSVRCHCLFWNLMVRESSASVTTADPAPTEAALAQALIGGYPDAPALAWRRYYPLVRGMLRRGLGAGDDLDDVVQDVFLSLFRCARALRKHEALRPFVIAITRHTLLRERRRRMRRRQFASEYGPWLAEFT